MNQNSVDRHAPTVADALRFWFKLGCISFGGPAGQIAIMHRELVEQRRWISERRFLHALNYCMLLPGPEAQQLATYLGWLMHRTWGGVAAGVLFVLPSLLLLIGLSWAYLAFGHLSWMAAVLWGIKPAVAALVLHAVQRMGSRTLHTPQRAFAVGDCGAEFSCSGVVASAVSGGGASGRAHGRADAALVAGAVWRRKCAQGGDCGTRRCASSIPCCRYDGWRQCGRVANGRLD